MRPCPPCTRTDAAVVPSAGDRGRRSERGLLSWGRVAPPASPGSRGILPHFPLQVACTPQSLLNTWLMKPHSGPPQERAPSFPRWSSDLQHRRHPACGKCKSSGPDLGAPGRASRCTAGGPRLALAAVMQALWLSQPPTPRTGVSIWEPPGSLSAPREGSGPHFPALLVSAAGLPSIIF